MYRNLFQLSFFTFTVTLIIGCASSSQSAPLQLGHSAQNLPTADSDLEGQGEPLITAQPENLGATPLLGKPNERGQDDALVPITTVGQTVDALPQSNAAWWDVNMANSFREDSASMEITVEDLLVRALQHSTQIRVFSELPLIRETSVVEADAAFDWHGFLDSRWDDLSDPVGNSLTVGGGQDRFNDHNLTGSIGARKRTRLGGQLEVAQQFGWQDNNSTFFTPDQQGTSRLVLSYTHPLMRGRGQVYNESLTVLAHIDSDIAGDELQRQLQSHLLEVVRAYWGLYLERGIYSQKIVAYERAKDIYGRLERRREIDAAASQLISAEAEVKSRRSELTRASAAVRNAEDRIRSLVNDPELNNDSLELIPIDLPTSHTFPVSMEESLATAVKSRPEVNQALKQIKASAIRVNMSKNELMPVLNLVTETYLSGLQGEGDVGQAWQNQFSVGQPSYSLGIQYEVPLENRAARARHIRRHLEFRQLQNQYETTIQTLKLETRVAVREVQTSHDELDTKLSALNAAKTKSDYILRRWELMPNDGRSGSSVLEDLLAAQAQLSAAEEDYLGSVVTYNLALMNLKRATGVLLQQEQVSIGRTEINRLPTQVISKPYLENQNILDYQSDAAVNPLLHPRPYEEPTTPAPPTPTDLDDLPGSSPRN